MADTNPLSPRENISGRLNVNIKVISAVHRPIPFILVKLTMTSSSESLPIIVRSRPWSTTAFAKPLIYFILEYDRPAARTFSLSSCKISFGEYGSSVLRSFRNLPSIVSAAFPESCCPIIWPTKWVNTSRTSSVVSRTPYFSIRFLKIGSFFRHYSNTATTI